MWEKFLYYADHIQWLDATTSITKPGTISFLAVLLPKSDPILFRSLRQLHWTESSHRSDDLFYMLRPTLDELKLQIYDFYNGMYNSFEFSDWAAWILHITSHLCPYIRFLSVGGMVPIILNPSVICYFGSMCQTGIDHRASDRKGD